MARQYDIFTPPEIQLARDAVQIERDAGEQDVRIFNAQMKVESQKKSVIQNAFEGMQDGLRLAEARQSLESSEIQMRRQKVQLAKDEMLNSFEIARARDDEAFIEQLRTASPAEQVAILDRADPAVLDRNRDVAMIALRGIENDVDAPPALREIVTNELIPKIDPSRQEAELKEQRLQARDERDFQQQRQLQNERLAFQERRDAQRRRDDMREASRKRRSEIIERRQEQQTALTKTTSALEADPYLRSEAQQRGQQSVQGMLENSTVRRVTMGDRDLISGGAEVGQYVIIPEAGDGSAQAPILLDTQTFKKIAQANQAKIQAGARQTQRNEVTQRPQQDAQLSQQVEASAKASYEARFGSGSWQNATEQTRNKVRSQIRAQIGS